MAYRKYHNKKVEYKGIKFDSKRECERYIHLKNLEETGYISMLEMQKKYVLIPPQREKGEDGKFGKVIERECAYIADFVYWDNMKKEWVVEDTKGFRTPEYIIKRKLMLAREGIRIREV